MRGRGCGADGGAGGGGQIVQYDSYMRFLTQLPRRGVVSCSCSCSYYLLFRYRYGETQC